MKTETPNPSVLIQSQWQDEVAPTDSVGQLVYASNLLGSDSRITNYGGGNTSLKSIETDPLSGEPVEVLWVKGSGGNLGDATPSLFASLYQSKLLNLELKYRDGSVSEDGIVALYPHCVFNLNPAPPSIDTPLHGFVPKAAVSHLHADSVIAIAASEDCESLTKEVFSGEIGFLPWQRPGFELGLMLKELIEENPQIKGAMMQSHGFICWADAWKECYELSLDIINQASTYIESKTTTSHPFGEVAPVEGFKSARSAAEILPVLRGKVSFHGVRQIATFDTSEEVLDFLNREEAKRLSGMGTSCPDHFLRTKIRPLVIEAGASTEEISDAFEGFRSEYKTYYERCKRIDSPPMRNPNPSIVLVRGQGMVSFGKNAKEAQITGAFFKNAIAVMKGAETISRYQALPEQEAFDIEYWQLEEAKLRRQPHAKELSGQIAIVTGGASGIGLATAKKMAQLGASVAILDINEQSLKEAVTQLEHLTDSESVLGLWCDVTKEGSINAAINQCICTFGGIDIAVINAGNARRGSVVDTSPEDYQFLSDLLMKGYFDAIGEAAKVMITQETGGSIVIVGSKNGVAAGSNAALYSAAKAFELHLMRVTASDLAKHKIRCNAVNPDGVVTGSAIWSDAWKTQTAKSLGISPDELVDHYAKRSLLGTVVSPEDCAEAICWLASEQKSSRTTGCIIPVDGGNKEGFLR